MGIRLFALFDGLLRVAEVRYFAKLCAGLMYGGGFFLSMGDLFEFRISRGVLYC